MIFSESRYRYVLYNDILLPVRLSFYFAIVSVVWFLPQTMIHFLLLKTWSPSDYNRSRAQTPVSRRVSTRWSGEDARAGRRKSANRWCTREGRDALVSMVSTSVLLCPLSPSTILFTTSLSCSIVWSEVDLTSSIASNGLSLSYKLFCSSGC